MTEWKKICRVDDIPVLGSRCVKRALGMDVALFRNDQNQVFALLDRCPHKGGPLSQGIVFGTQVACPLHNWTISLSDGCARAPDVTYRRFSGIIKFFSADQEKSNEIVPTGNVLLI